MGMEPGPDIVFDFEGALAMARRLWAFADELMDAAQRREVDSAHAKTDWTGRYGDEFGRRGQDEWESLCAAAANLRNESIAWAAAWQRAMTKKNAHLYALKMQHVEQDRGAANYLPDVLLNRFLVGEPDLPPMPEMVRVPSAPSFAPTAHFYNG